MTTPLCQVCHRNPLRFNNGVAECSHVDCPNRKRWSLDDPIAYEPPRDDVSPLEDLFDSPDDQ